MPAPKYTPARGGHAPSHLREAFEDAIGYLDPTIPPAAVALTGRLWNCTDTMPSALCESLSLPRFVLGHGAVRTAVASISHASRRSVHMTVLFRPFMKLMQPSTKAPAPRASTCPAVSVTGCGRRG